MIKQLTDILNRLELIAKESNNGDRLKASRMLRDMTMEYTFLNVNNYQRRADFVRKYQQRYKLEFGK